MATKTTKVNSSITTTTSRQPNMWSNGLSILGTAAQAYKTYADWNAPDVNYDILNIQADFKDNQALDVEYQNIQQVNYLRQQFSGAVGSYKYGESQRGVKVGEGTGVMNIEASARDLGYDINKMTGNANWKAKMLRSEADRLRLGAEGQKEVNYWERVGGLFDNIGKLAGLFGTIDFGSTMSTTKTAATTVSQVGGAVSGVSQKEIKQPAEELVNTTGMPENEDIVFTNIMKDEKIPYASTKQETIQIGKEQTTSNEFARLNESEKMDKLTQAINSGITQEQLSSFGGIKNMGMDNKSELAVQMANKNIPIPEIRKSLGLTQAQINKILFPGG